MKLQKKIVRHRDAAWKVRSVAYVIIGRDYVFSGLEAPGTTINFAEDIIVLICAAERLDPRRITFYDLQTYRSYISKKPGEYELDKLTLKFGEGRFGFYATTWASAPKWPTPCSNACASPTTRSTGSPGTWA